VSEFTKKEKPTFESDNAREGNGMGKGDVDALGGLRDSVSWRMQGGARRERTPKEGGACGGLCHSARWRRPGTLRCQAGMNSGLTLGWGK
jgi:hypothetical protein